MSAGAPFVLSGIPAGDSGTGRLVSHLRGKAERRSPGCTVVARPDPPVRFALLLRQRRFAEAAGFILRHQWDDWRFRRGLAKIRRQPQAPLLILHPQTLGFALTLRLIEERAVPPMLFLLDSSFFCIASYNHVGGEHQPCERCLGGHYAEAQRLGCEPFPKPDPAARDYVQRLRELVIAGRARVVAQTRAQASLAQRHFGLAAAPPVVGLWTADWDSLLEAAAPRAARAARAERWDVVFHGFDLEAKGSRWLEELAAELPARRFLFPFATPPRRTPPPNCSYVPMSWESGLEEAVRAAAVVAAPSLWSAPIEGALVKSIALGAAVAVVENPSAYGAELPPELLTVLPSDPRRAAERLEAALREGRTLPAAARRKWLETLRGERAQFTERLFATVPRAA